MSSSAAQNQRAPLSQDGFSRLSATLTQSNEHYRSVAAANRVAQKPTHHARKRAHKLGLSVDTKLAVDCPQKYVSVVPLPVIDTTPVQECASLSRSRQRPTLRLEIPRPAADVPVSGGPFSALSLASGVIPAAVAPTVLRGQNIPWRGPTSRFSITPNDPIFTLASRRAPEPPVIPDISFESDDEMWNLQYPPSGAADYAPSSPSSVSSSSGSSSSSSSGGLATPADAEVIPGLLLASKRKCDLEYEFVDKRPKYERKDWVRNPRKLR